MKSEWIWIFRDKAKITSTVYPTFNQKIFRPPAPHYQSIATYHYIHSQFYRVLSARKARMEQKELLQQVYESPPPWVCSTHPKIAVIVKERKWNVIDWKQRDN